MEFVYDGMCAVITVIHSYVKCFICFYQIYCLSWLLSNSIFVEIYVLRKITIYFMAFPLACVIVFVLVIYSFWWFHVRYVKPYFRSLLHWHLRNKRTDLDNYGPSRGDYLYCIDIKSERCWIVNVKNRFIMELILFERLSHKKHR